MSTSWRMATASASIEHTGKVMQCALIMLLYIYCHWPHYQERSNPHVTLQALWEAVPELCLQVPTIVSFSLINHEANFSILFALD